MESNRYIPLTRSNKTLYKSKGMLLYIYCLMGLWNQINRYPSRDQTNLHTKVRRLTLNIMCNNPTPNCINIVYSKLKYTALKHIYIVKKNLYLYNIKNFSFY